MNKGFVKKASDLAVMHKFHWPLLAREDQWPPVGDWMIWLMMGGRGAGKTRAGAEWLRRRIRQGARRVALIAPNFNDAREVMLGGESGLLNLGASPPTYQASRHRLEWPNGAEGYVFSAEDPDSLRGPQFEFAWADEFCAWKYPEATLSNLRLGLRLGDRPRLVITTTPRPIPALKALIMSEAVAITRAKTKDNAGNLSPVFLSAMEEAYGGTQLGRQELEGELIFDQEGALFTRALVESAFTTEHFGFAKVIVAIDPPVTSGKRSDACGLIVAGLVEGNGHVHILHDGTVQGVSPKYEQGRVKHQKRFPELEDELCRLGLSCAGRESPDRADALVWAVTDLLLKARTQPRIRSL